MRVVSSTRAQYEALNPADVIQLSPMTRNPAVVKPKAGLSKLQKWGYGVLLGIFVFGCFQVLRCATLSTVKLEKLWGQKAAVEAAFQQAQKKNTLLKDKIVLYSSPLGVEEMARERLSLVAEDEILIQLYPAQWRSKPAKSFKKTSKSILSVV